MKLGPMTRDLAEDMRPFGFLAQRNQLADLGHSTRQIRSAIAEHMLVPIRRPWVATSAADPDAVRSVMLGGRLGGASALRSYRVWVGRPSGLWVHASAQSSRLPPTRRGERRITTIERFPTNAEIRWRVSPSDALVQVFLHGETTDAIASLESARHQGLIDDLAVRNIANALPRSQRRMLERSRRGAMSGIETLFRLAAEAQGWKVDIQVYVTGVGHVDVLIDGWLVIELDGGGHAELEQMHIDRRRDAELILLGYRYHRFDYPQLMNDMDRCIGVTRRLLAGGRPPVY